MSTAKGARKNTLPNIIHFDTVDCIWGLYFVDVDTRRRAACDLVQALCKSFEGPVIQNFSQYVQALLQVGQVMIENTIINRIDWQNV